MSDDKDQSGRVVPFARRGGKCPVCGQVSAGKYRPFCSERCADVDLGRWLKGGYRIPGPPAPDQPEEGGDDEDEPY